MNTSSQEVIVAAFYKFVEFPKPERYRPQLKSYMVAHNIKGTVLLAPEGINGTVSGSREEIDAFLTYLKSHGRLSDLEHKESRFTRQPFERTKVKMKKEIISLGEPASPTEKVGTYVEPKYWNSLISDPDVITIDTRNTYEIHLGKFKGAVDPQTRTFKEIPNFTKEELAAHKNKKIAMYCTGGIRCEKYSSYLLEQGFNEVYHLKGGVLKYLEEIPQEESLWEGECYVFDDRVAVKHGLVPSDEAAICPSCGHSLFSKDRIHPKYVHGKSCAYCT